MNALLAQTGVFCMRRTQSLFLILLLVFFGFSLFAQEEDPDDEYPEPDWIEIASSPYVAGDRNFVITLGVIIPTFFGGIENNQHGLSLGGFGSLALNYFLSSNIFIGAELSGMFSGTRAGNMLYIVPFGARVGYQFLMGRFEVPVSVMVGAAPQRYLDKGYFGLIVKPAASVFWRYNPDWSFGFNTAWWLLPQSPKNGKNTFGNFLELTLSARYHF